MAFQFRNGGKDRQEIEGIVPVKSESCTFTPTNAECSKKSQEVKIEVVPFEVPWQQDRTDYPAQGLSCLRSLRGANQDKFFCLYSTHASRAPSRTTGKVQRTFQG